MTPNQLFLSVAAFGFVVLGFIKYYIDAKIDPLTADIKMLVNYLILHEGKISRLQEKTKSP